jgi:hypothetical protein
MTQLPQWVWLVAGLVLVAWLWETNRKIAAVLVILIALAHVVISQKGGAQNARG